MFYNPIFVFPQFDTHSNVPLISNNPDYISAFQILPNSLSKPIRKQYFGSLGLSNYFGSFKLWLVILIAAVASV